MKNLFYLLLFITVITPTTLQAQEVKMENKYYRYEKAYRLILEDKSMNNTPRVIGLVFNDGNTLNFYENETPTKFVFKIIGEDLYVLVKTQSLINCYKVEHYVLLICYDSFDENLPKMGNYADKSIKNIFMFSGKNSFYIENKKVTIDTFLQEIKYTGTTPYGSLGIGAQLLF